MDSNAVSSIKIITWEGKIGIERAKELKAELLKEFSLVRQVVVSLSLVSAIDVTGIQLLYAAHAFSLREGKQFHLTGTVAPSIEEAFVSGGFIRGSCKEAKDLENRLFEAGTGGARA
jgi:anti-anti-sigma regulatory factor